MGISWTILIGFVAGVLAKLITPGDNEPSGFILKTILGIVGAFVATYLGQALNTTQVMLESGVARAQQFGKPCHGYCAKFAKPHTGGEPNAYLRTNFRRELRLRS